jgi:glycosyltransferase involved in cell wall biosynthesis
MKKLYKLLSILLSLKNSKNRIKFLIMLQEYTKGVPELSHFFPTPANTAYSDEMLNLGASSKILLVVHEFSRTGAPYAALYLARAFFSLRDVRATVISPLDGPMREVFEQEGFPTIVDPLLFSYSSYSSEACEFVANFEQVIVSSLAAFGFIRYFRGIAKHLTWWLHETDTGFTSVANIATDLPLLFACCESIWLCSPLCFPIALRYTSQDKLHLLFYGCKDMAISHRPHESGKMVFSIVGSMEPRKGQDIFLNAIEQLPEELRAKAIFRIIGSPLAFKGSEIFYQEVLTKAARIPEVECFESMSQEKLLAFYAETDVLVSASRDDPMPIVVTEGLMFSNVCLCSSAIGHAQLLENGKDGLIFTTESAEDLAEKMAELLQNPAELATLGAAGRQLYEKYFLMSSFASNVKNLMLHDR